MEEVKELTREELAGLSKRPVQELLIPELKRKVYWRKLNGREQAEAEDYIKFGEDGKATKESMDVWSSRLAAASLCDHSGIRLYKKDELNALDDAPSDFVIPIYNAVRQVTSAEALKN